MWSLFLVSFKGVFRDRVFQGILLTAVAFLIIPALSMLSMRQVATLSLTLSLSLLSFILLLLAVFLGGTSLWKDIERRYTFSVLGLPLSRTTYMLGKFSAIAGFLLLVAVFLGSVSIAVSLYVAGQYPPDRPISWDNVVLCILFDVMKYSLLVAFAFLFSTVSTSFFLPVFGTIAIFLIGGASQQVYDFLQTPNAQTLPVFLQKIANILYYIVPNFSAFDLKVHAIYGVPVSMPGLLLTTGYFFFYLTVLLALAAICFCRRELQ